MLPTLGGKRWSAGDAVEALPGIARAAPDVPVVDLNARGVLAFDRSQLFEKGRRNKEMVDILGVEVRLVESSRQRVKKKRDCPPASEWTRLAVSWAQGVAPLTP